MRLFFILGIIPVPVFYTKRMDKKFAGMSYGFFILIRPSYRRDKGLHQHELEHARQFWCGLWVIHALLYRYYDRYRAWAEIEAYKVQLSHAPPTHYSRLKRKYALFIATKYKLDITPSEAERKL